MIRVSHESKAPSPVVGSGTANANPLYASALHTGMLSAGWLLLTDASMPSWVVGIPAVSAAAWALRRTMVANPAPISLAGIVRFVPFFLWQSVRGGLDVAIRTLAPRMRIHPGFVTFRTRLGQPRSRVFLTYCINLLPGTLTADLDEDRLHVHLLDTHTEPDPELRLLEDYVARVFGDDARAAEAHRDASR